MIKTICNSIYTLLLLLCWEYTTEQKKKETSANRQKMKENIHIGYKNKSTEQRKWNQFRTYNL